jgi:hypothetical protein
MSIKELAAWGEDHSDPWVKRLAYYAEMLSYLVPSEYRNDPDEWFESNDTQIHDLERDAEYHEEARDEAYREMEEWKEKYDALRLEFNLREENHTITHLKARIQTQYDELAANAKQREVDAKFHSSVVAELSKLKKKYDELHEKYNVFTIIAS